jgi:serine/threonine-protein kinase
MENAAGLGHTDMKPVEKMPDGSHRIFMSHNGSLIPSFPLRLVMHFNGIQPDQASVQNDRIILNEEILPLIGGAILTHGAGDKDAFKRLSFSTLLNSKELISGLRDKIVIIGIEKPVDPYKHNGAAGDRSASHRMASVTRDILNNSLVSRPAYIPYVETLFLVFLTMVLLIFFNHRNNSIRLSGIFLLLILTIATATLFLSIMDIWFKSIYIIGSLVTAFLYLSTESRLQPKGKTGESRETTRLLGLNFQSQGLLDLAFDKFKSLPLDKEVKDLIYNLGADYEEKGLSSKAVAVYEYINRQGGFRDLDERIATLKAVENTLDGSEEYEIDKETTMVTETESKTPRMVGRYKILGQLGRGSMGLVYKAQDPKINRVVAIKTIRFSDEFYEDVIYQIKERFFSEAEIAGKLSHPAIVTIHDVGDDNDLTYMAMEYLEGQSLEAFIEKKNLLPFRTVLDIVKEIAEALDFAHQAGVIHREIKPANVMLLENGHVKVTDFGIAKAISSSRTKTGVILGTPNYMSPEQIMGQKINSKSDIFSLGVVFYQLITGELPFHGDNLSGLLYQITQVKHPSPRSYNQRLPKVCEQIIDKAMAKAPDKRFRTAGDLARIISALADKIDQIRAQRAS